MNSTQQFAMNIVLIVRLYPPVNSSGAKRAEALSKYFVRMGHNVSVITPAKTLADGDLTESTPEGVDLIELDGKGQDSESRAVGQPHEPLYAENRSCKRLIKDTVMEVLGQLPDPRLPFVLSLRSKRLSTRADRALRKAHVVIGSCPPWSMLLAALFVKWRFRTPIVLDYRDNFSENPEMPGSRFAKWLERKADRWLIANADQAVAATVIMQDYYSSMSKTPCAMIMNGYDHEKVQLAFETARVKEDGLVRIRHTGLVSPQRIPHAFTTALEIFMEENPQAAARIRLEFYGYSDVFRRHVSDEHAKLSDIISFHKTVPHHDVLKLMRSADYLLFCGYVDDYGASARGMLTTKLFEYLATGRPVLAHIDPTFSAAELIQESGGHHLISATPDDYLDLLRSDTFFDRKSDYFGSKIESLTRESQARDYAELLGRLVFNSKES